MPWAASPGVWPGVSHALDLQMHCNRDTEAQPGKGSVRLDIYPLMAKKARDPRELFVNLNGSNILDEVPPEESALWVMIKSAVLMVPLMNIHHILDAIPPDAVAASALIRKLPASPTGLCRSVAPSHGTSRTLAPCASSSGVQSYDPDRLICPWSCSRVVAETMPDHSHGYLKAPARSSVWCQTDIYSQWCFLHSSSSPKYFCCCLKAL